MRVVISRLPARVKPLVTDVIALLVYWPLARLGERLGLNTKNMPLHYYRGASFYTMRTDSRDRFGTSLEQRLTRAEIRAMMTRAGLERIVISEEESYWCAVGTKAA